MQHEITEDVVATLAAEERRQLLNLLNRLTDGPCRKGEENADAKERLDGESDRR